MVDRPSSPAAVGSQVTVYLVEEAIPHAAAHDAPSTPASHCPASPQYQAGTRNVPGTQAYQARPADSDQVIVSVQQDSEYPDCSLSASSHSAQSSCSAVERDAVRPDSGIRSGLAILVAAWRAL